MYADNLGRVERQNVFGPVHGGVQPTMTDFLDTVRPEQRALVLRQREAFTRLERTLEEHRGAGFLRLPERDARRAVFGRAIGIVRTANIILRLSDDYLVGDSERVFWEKHFGTKKRAFADCYAGHLVANTHANLLISTVSNAENSMRIFVRALDPSACKGGTDDFIRIYEWLLERLKLQHHLELFNLLRLTRNTIHNGGSYFHKSKDEDEATYKGKTYNFKKGFPIEFVPLEGMLSLFLDLATALREIVDAPELAAKRLIEDHGTLLYR